MLRRRFRPRRLLASSASLQGSYNKRSSNDFRPHPDNISTSHRKSRLARLQSVLLQPLFSRTLLHCQGCHAPLVSTANLKFVRHRGVSELQLRGSADLPPRRMLIDYTRPAMYDNSVRGHLNHDHTVPDVRCASCHFKLGTIQSSSPESQPTVSYSARGVSLTTTSFISGNHHALRTRRWGKLSAAEMHLVGIPFVHVLPSEQSTETVEQTQQFVNEQRGDGTFRWKFVMDPSLTQQPTDDDLGFFSQAHDDTEAEALPTFDLQNLDEDDEPLFHDKSLKHLSGSQHDSRRLLDHVMLWWDDATTGLRSSMSDILYLAKQRLASRPGAQLHRAVMSIPNWHVDGAARAYYTYKELKEKGYYATSSELQTLLASLVHQAFRPDATVETASFVGPVLRDLEAYGHAERRLVLQGLTQGLFQILSVNGDEPRVAAEHLTSLGAVWNRDDWQALCFWLYQHRDIEAFVEVAGLFELDVGMHTVPVLSPPLASSLAAARPFTLQARLKASAPHLVQLLYQRGQEQNRLKPEERATDEADAYRRCLLFLEAAKHLSGLNVASYVKSLQVILSLYARSGTAEQLKETLRRYTKRSRMTLNAHTMRSVLHGCLRHDDSEVIHLGLEVFDQFVASRRKENQPITANTVGIALTLCRRVKDHRRARRLVQAVPEHANDHGLVLSSLRVAASCGKVNQVLQNLKDTPLSNAPAPHSLAKLGILVTGLLEANRLVDAVFVSYCCMELATSKAHRSGLDILRHIYQLNTPNADLVGMALARDMCEQGVFAQQMEDAANGTIDLHGLGAGPAKMLTLAYLEDLKVARRRYMAKRSRVNLKKGAKSMLILPANKLDEQLLTHYWATRTKMYSPALKQQLTKQGLEPNTPAGLQMAVAFSNQTPSDEILKLFEGVTTLSSERNRPVWMEQVTPGDNILTPWDYNWTPPSTIRSRINIITGKGINSKDGPVIRPMIFKLLTREVSPPIPPSLRMNKEYGSVMIYPQFVAEWFDSTKVRTTAWDASSREPRNEGGSNPTIVSAAELAAELAQEDKSLLKEPVTVTGAQPPLAPPPLQAPDQDRGQWWGTGQVARAERGSTPLLDATETDSRHSRTKSKPSLNPSNDSKKK
eukprot:m.232038 g.232038  ORF g.232038 m.232038 type:complete len:1112 (-) comp17372_c0_seq6:1806-5141(-)